MTADPRTPEQIAAERYDGDVTGYSPERAAFVAGWREHERDAEADYEKLYRLLQFRDDFICAHGLWNEFMNELTAGAIIEESDEDLASALYVALGKAEFCLKDVVRHLRAALSRAEQEDER
jgi:hypothetical protein